MLWIDLYLRDNRNHMQIRLNMTSLASIRFRNRNDPWPWFVNSQLYEVALKSCTTCHAGAKSLLILDLGTRWGWVVSVTLRPRFSPAERTAVPIGQNAGWASELVWTQRLEEKSFVSTWDRTPVVQSVRHYTDLRYPSSYEIPLQRRYRTVLPGGDT
jgi:hypothetical protein